MSSPAGPEPRVRHPLRLARLAGADGLGGDDLSMPMAAGGPAEPVRLVGHLHLSFALTRLLRSAADHGRTAVAALARAFSGN